MVCSDIKEALTAKVAGPCPDKVCYRLLSGLACLAFLFAVVNVLLGVQEIVTEVEVDNLDIMLFPTAWFCLRAEHVEPDVGIMRIDGPDCNSDQAVVKANDLQSNTVVAPRCIDFKDRDTSTLARDLEARFLMFDPGNPRTCYTMNENDRVSSVPSVHTRIEFEWSYNFNSVDPAGLLSLNAGIFDPKGRTLAEQVESGFSVYEVDITNTDTAITFTVDELIKQNIASIITSTRAGANIHRLSSMTQVEAVNSILEDDSVVLKYSPSKSSVKISPITQITGRGKIEFQPLSYVTRVVTQRYKTWDEIWSAIGGAWATAVLLVTAFYVQKNVEDPKKKGQEAEPMDQVHVFRLRGASSKRAAIKRLYSVAADAYGAGKSSVEEGQAAVEGLGNSP